MTFWYERLMEKKGDFGIHEIAVVPMEQVVFSDGVRLLCEQNSCGGYAKTWACPPGVGTLEECRKRMTVYDRILVYTTKHMLEDSYDWEGMMDGKKVDHVVVRAANIFLLSYLLILFSSMLLLSLDNHDFTTSVTAVISALNNIGPGLSLVGPTGNFGFFSDFSKYVLMFDMLAGRLEVFPMLLLFVPAVWKK